MILNFEDCTYETDIDALTSVEVASLAAGVTLWNSEQLKPAINVISDWHNLAISEELMTDVLTKNLDLAFEVYSGSVRDTFVRDHLIDMIMREVGLTPWPCFGDSSKYKQEFYDALEEKAKDGRFKILD